MSSSQDQISNLSEAKRKELDSFKGPAFKEFFSKTFELFVKIQPKDDSIAYEMADFHDLARKKWSVVSLAQKHNFFEKSKKAMKKEKKKNKDPNAPKKPLTSFNLFCQEYRSGIEKGSAGTPSLKVMAQKWSVLGQDIKDGFTGRAEKEKLRYQEELESYERAVKVTYLLKLCFFNVLTNLSLPIPRVHPSPRRTCRRSSSFRVRNETK